eukprot:2144807-Pleurochrysis_carterae.AAC.3
MGERRCAESEENIEDDMRGNTYLGGDGERKDEWSAREGSGNWGGRIGAEPLIMARGEERKGQKQLM